MKLMSKRDERADSPPAASPVAIRSSVPVAVPRNRSRSMQVLGWFRLSRHRAFITLAVFLVGWQLVSRYVVNDALMLTGPWESVKALGTSWDQGQLRHDLWISGFEFILGFVPSVIIGILIGMLLGVSDRAKGYIDPALNAWYATPIIALIPLFVLWFGIGTEKTIVMIAALVFITCTINTDVGIRATDQRLVEAARSFGANRAELFLKVRLPTALPFIITGIRLSIGRGLIGVIVGEFYGSDAGIGYRILQSSTNFDTALLLGCVILTAVVGVGLVAIMEWIEAKAAPWQAAQKARS
jgi:NitT/TauT family transport system permease protein